MVKTRLAVITRQELEESSRLAALTNELATRTAKVQELERIAQDISEKVETRKRLHTNAVRRLHMGRNVVRMSVDLAPPPRAPKAFQSVTTVCDPVPMIEDYREKITTAAAEAAQHEALLLEGRALNQHLHQLEAKINLQRLDNEQNEIRLHQTVRERQVTSKPPPSPESQYNGKAKREASALLLEQVKEQIETADAEFATLIQKTADLKNICDFRRRQMQLMARKPKSDVPHVCDTLHEQRFAIQASVRRLSFVRIQIANVDQEIKRYRDLTSASVLAGFRQKIEAMVLRLDAMKRKFRTQRGASEQSGLILTTGEELSMLQAKIHEMASETDVVHMRMNGITARIDKLCRAAQRSEIPVPQCPD
jgi:hypothetical protein